MNIAIERLREMHENLCESIDRKHERIANMEEMLSHTKQSLAKAIEERDAIEKAIYVLTNDLPTRLEGSD